MKRVLINNLKDTRLNSFARPILQYRCLGDKTEMIIGGGLEKPQGGLKEEKYFYNQNSELIAKLREQGTKLKCENHDCDWHQFEKVLEASDDRTALRETCSLNKNKNCLEEAFFLDQQSECCAKLNKESDKEKQNNTSQNNFVDENKIRN